MTTTVTIEAHCTSDKQVRIAIKDSVTGGEKPTVVIQDKEKYSCVVYDNWHVDVAEELK